MEWLRLNSNFPNHPKHGRLSRRLGISREQAAWLVIRLWCWVAQTIDHGDLSGVDPEDLADACGWTGDPAVLIRSLREVGWVDPNGALHEWRDYQAQVFSGRERSKKWRENHDKQRNVTVTSRSRYRNVTVTATGQDRTGQDREAKNDGSEHAPHPPESGRALLDFPIQDGTTWMLPAAKAEEWSLAFPALDLERELRSARQWLLDHPSRRKTATGMPRFLGGWLRKEAKEANGRVRRGGKAWKPPADHRDRPPVSPEAALRVLKEDMEAGAWLETAEAVNYCREWCRRSAEFSTHPGMRAAIDAADAWLDAHAGPQASSAAESDHGDAKINPEPPSASGGESGKP